MQHFTQVSGVQRLFSHISTDRNCHRCFFHYIKVPRKPGAEIPSLRGDTFTYQVDFQCFMGLERERNTLRWPAPRRCPRSPKPHRAAAPRPLRQLPPALAGCRAVQQLTEPADHRPGQVAERQRPGRAALHRCPPGRWRRPEGSATRAARDGAAARGEGGGSGERELRAARATAP